MEDREIVELYWARSEAAVDETAKKYGGYCRYIAMSILESPEDAEECVNDAFLHAWDSIPPQRPERLSAYLGRLTRNAALNRLTHDRAEKRGGAEVILAELSEVCAPAPNSGEALPDELALREAINSFLASLHKDTRIIFVRRYWYMSPISDIARDHGIPEGTVKATLSRARKRFRAHLLKEGITL